MELPDFLEGESIVLEMLSQCSGSYMFAGDMVSEHCKWSENALSQLSFSENGNIEDTFRQLVHPQDYKDFKDKLDLLIQGKQSHLNGEYRLRLRDGGYTWTRANAVLVRKGREARGIIAGVLTNIDTNNRIDSVTNLKGNYDFRRALSDLKRQTTPYGVLIIGIDYFKRINDFYAYSIGDKVLAAFASDMQESLPEKVLLYRLDGDGFGILYPNAGSKDMARCFDRIQEIAGKERRIGESSVSFTISGGLCMYPKDGSGEQLYRNTRMALSEAKEVGRNRMVTFSKELSSRTQYNMRLLERLQRAVHNGFKGFSMRYQPLMSAKTGVLSGCEALLRWEDRDFPDGVPPSEFIPLLEETGLILEVGGWVLDQAFGQLAKWRKILPDFQMNVNVASRQFENSDFKNYVMDKIAQYDLPPYCVTLELTESGSIDNTEEVGHVFDFLRSQGIKIAFDDFGTGYASLSIFRLLSADELKIDRSFLDRISYDVTDQKLVSQIVTMCHGMNITVCVEGIDSSEMEQVIKEFGPDLLQGYYYSTPIRAEEFNRKYFRDKASVSNDKNRELHADSPERENSMVYAPVRPAQSMSVNELIDNAHAGIFQVGMDQEFTFMTCNEGYRRMLGYTAKEIERKFRNRALGFVYPDDMEYVNQEIRRQLGQGDTVTLEFRVVRSDGTPLWIIGTGNVVQGKHGDASLVVVIVEDNDIKTMNLALKRDRDLFERVLGRIPGGVKCVRFDEYFTIDYISPGFLALLGGYTLQDVEERFQNRYLNIIYEEDREVVINDVLEQLKLGNLVRMRYRNYCKDGSLIWIETVSMLYDADEDGVQRAYSFLINAGEDIGETSEKERLISIANRYRIAAEQWGDVLFEYNFKNQKYSMSENYANMFGRKPVEDIRREFKNIYKEDRKKVLDMIPVMRGGVKPDPVEIRIKKGDGTYIWCSLVFNEPDRMGDTPVMAVGKICNIDAQKKEKERLIEQSRRDFLTGLFSKQAVEEEIRKILSDPGRDKFYAFYMADMDNFKWINNNLGHMKGDELLCIAAKKIKSVFPKNAVIGRAGGDEFVIFAEYDGERTSIEKKGNEMVGQFGRKLQKNGEDCLISISVGVSLYPVHGTEFYELYRYADSALYLAKERGKNAVCISP